MIPKANQRAGGRQLATHLLNEFDNDRVEVAHLRGAIANDLHGAFAEWRAVARATLCQKYLYSLSVNPDPKQRPVTREELYDYIARVEKKLGLTGQPRAVVFHVKYGREHCHVVWSRIDTDRMKAVQISHDRQKLRLLTRAFARDHGLMLPPGMREDRRLDRFNRLARNENLAEKQQEERSGISKAERMDAITAAWRGARTGEEFFNSLARLGYFIARGDRRAYVVVDLHGEIHSLARQIEGVRVKELRERLRSYPVEHFPDARKAQAFARGLMERKRTPSLTDILNRTAARLRDDLARNQSKRRAVIKQRQQKLLAQHKAERKALLAMHESINRGILITRLGAQPTGMIAFLARITGIRLLVGIRHKRQDAARAAEHAAQIAALERRHLREQAEFRRHNKALDSLDAREQRSINTAIRREQFRLAARPDQRPAPSLEPGRRPDRQEPRRPAHEPQGKVARAFNEAVTDQGRVPKAARAPEQPSDKGTLRAQFVRSAIEERARKALDAWHREQRDQARHSPEHRPDRPRGRDR